MKRYRWQVLFGLSLILLAILLHFIHYLIFRDPRQMFFYMVGDIAFIPIQVLIVTLIIDKVLNVREKRAKMRKLNMAIGAFFSAVGTKLLASLSEFNINVDDLTKIFIVTDEWSEEKFHNVIKQFKKFDYTMNSRNSDLQKLKDFLTGERDFLLNLLGNPNLLEHDRFTNLLWAVFHLMEELAYRKNVTKLSDKDYDHLSGDMKRAYTLLIHEWLEYMKHLKNNYPYLFSLAMRTNPFDPNALPEIN
jgi:hypothetical protein